MLNSLSTGTIHYTDQYFLLLANARLRSANNEVECLKTLNIHPIRHSRMSVQSKERHRRFSEHPHGLQSDPMWGRNHATNNLLAADDSGTY